jgi:predicted PurR-regulated permease PerM
MNDAAPAIASLASAGEDAGAVPVVVTRMTAQSIALITLAVLAVFWALSVAAEIVVPLLLAMVLKLTLQPAMRFLSGWARLPVAVSAFVLIVVLFGVVTGIGVSIAVPASGWIAKAPQGLKTLQDQLGQLRVPLASVQYFFQQAQSLIEPANGAAPAAPAGPAIGLGSVAMSVLLGTQVFFGRLFVLLVALFFMLAADDSMLRKLVEVIPRFQ